VFACSLKTRELVGQLSPNFQGSSKVLRGWFKVQKSWGGVMVKGHN